MADISNYIAKQLRKKSFTEDQIKEVLEIVVELLPKPKDDALSLIKYANQKFEKKYGNEGIFVYFPVSAQLMKYVTEFQQRQKLTAEKYRRYIEWLMLMGEQKIHRIPLVKDLWDSKVFAIFVNEAVNDTATEALKKKKKILSKNLLVVE